MHSLLPSFQVIRDVEQHALELLWIFDAVDRAAELGGGRGGKFFGG